MRAQKYISGIVYFLFILSVSCTPGKKPDIGNIHVDLHIKRLERDLFEPGVDKINEQIPVLQAKYGNFFELYNQLIIKIGESKNPAYPDYLKAFLTDYINYQVYEKSQELYPDLSAIEKGLSLAFRYYLYYFPEKSVPEVFTYISGFNQSISVDENILAIGLDRYLGKDCEFYARLGIPVYLHAKMTPSQIVPDGMKAWAISEFPYNDSSDNLIAQMIYEGQIMYFMDATLPDVPDTLKLGFSAKQLEWCEKSERNMWEHLASYNLLFSTDYMTLIKFINDAPYTHAFGNDSPGRAVVWSGWQIVKKYAEETGLPLKEIMEETDYRKILTVSAYNP